jgi:hypothetical protein
MSRIDHPFVSEIEPYHGGRRATRRGGRGPLERQAAQEEGHDRQAYQRERWRRGEASAASVSTVTPRVSCGEPPSVASSIRCRRWWPTVSLSSRPARSPRPPATPALHRRAHAACSVAPRRCTGPRGPASCQSSLSSCACAPKSTRGIWCARRVHGMARPPHASPRTPAARGDGAGPGGAVRTHAGGGGAGGAGRRREHALREGRHAPHPRRGGRIPGGGRHAVAPGCRPVCAWRGVRARRAQLAALRRLTARPHAARADGARPCAAEGPPARSRRAPWQAASDRPRCRRDPRLARARAAAGGRRRAGRGSGNGLRRGGSRARDRSRSR